MKTAVANIEAIVSGDWRNRYVVGDAILMEQGRIMAVGNVLRGPQPQHAGADAAACCRYLQGADGLRSIHTPRRPHWTRPSIFSREE